MLSLLALPRCSFRSGPDRATTWAEPGAWPGPGLPAATARVEPAGPRADSGRLEDAEEERGRCRRGRGW